MLLGAKWGRKELVGVDEVDYNMHLYQDSSSSCCLRTGLEYLRIGIVPTKKDAT
jgi:hypothetical protein